LKKKGHENVTKPEKNRYGRKTITKNLIKNSHCYPKKCQKNMTGMFFGDIAMKKKMKNVDDLWNLILGEKKKMYI